MGQSAKTEIIEFNGLAGCGKTTLAGQLKNELIRQGYRAVLLGEANRIFKQHLIKNIIRAFNCSLFIRYIYLFLLIGRKRENTWFIYWTALKISLIYRWCIKNEEFDFVLCDHGLIQNFISLLGFEVKACKKFNKCLASILKSESKIYMVNCNVSVELSSNRIRSRKKNTGRLDVISNYQYLKKLLRITEINFFTIRNIVNMVQIKWPIIDLETDVPSQNNVQRIINLLTQRNIYYEF